MLILVPRKTNRINYIFRLLLNRLLGLDVEFTTDIEEFKNAAQPKMAYGMKVGGGLYFDNCSLLFETKISSIHINYIKFDGLPAPFPVSDKDSSLPFDVFAASFYLVSRFEEYLPHIKDKHGRFLAEGSEAFRNGFLDKPLVNLWALKLGQIIADCFPGIKLKKTDFQIIPSIDIDSAFAYRHKGMTRAIGGLIKSLLLSNYSEFTERFKVITHRITDPFDTFDYQQKLWSHFGLKPRYFVLFAKYGEYDKNIPVNNRFFRDLLKSLADTSIVGIHPSYASSVKPELLEKEIRALSGVLKCNIEHSRQHFLRLEIPVTYRNLIHFDITHDYTMGYAETPGFRASICSEFPFYDLDEETETNLLLQPFGVMDSNYIDYLRLSPDQAYESMNAILREVKMVKGDFVILWHNHTLSRLPYFDGWRKAFTRLLESATGIPLTDELK